MMTKTHAVTLLFKNGKTLEIDRDDFVDFAFMDQGLFFYQSKHTERSKKGEVIVSYDRHWISLSELARIDMNSEINLSGEERDFYHALKSRGVNISEIQIDFGEKEEKAKAIEEVQLQMRLNKNRK